jgi:hypothetical protein
LISGSIARLPKRPKNQGCRRGMAQMARIETAANAASQGVG